MRISDWSSDVCSSDLWDGDDARALNFDICWEWVPFSQRHGREKFYQRFKPFRGGKKHQPQDSYSLRCIPQVHGAVRDAVAQARRVLDVELNAVTDNPLVFPRSEEHTSELQSLMRHSYAVFCLK